MIHSAALVLDGAAALFFAPDEGGKTTIARHALPGMTMCDIQNIMAIMLICPKLPGYKPSNKLSMCAVERPASVPTCPKLSGYRPTTSYTFFTAERPASAPTCPEPSVYKPSTSYTMCAAERPPTGCAFQRIL